MINVSPITRCHDGIVLKVAYNSSIHERLKALSMFHALAANRAVRWRHTPQIIFAKTNGRDEACSLAFLTNAKRGYVTPAMRSGARRVSKRLTFCKKRQNSPGFNGHSLSCRQGPTTYGTDEGFLSTPSAPRLLLFFVVSVGHEHACGVEVGREQVAETS